MVGLDDECQGNMDAGHPRAKCCPFFESWVHHPISWQVFPTPAPLCPPPKDPSFNWLRRWTKEKWRGLFFITGFSLRSALALLFFFPGSLLIKKRWEARKDLEGLPDRASVHGNNHPGCMNCRYNGFTAMTEYWALKLFHCLRCANGRHFLGREWSSLTRWHCHTRAALPVCSISLVAYRR